MSQVSSTDWKHQPRTGVGTAELNLAAEFLALALAVSWGLDFFYNQRLLFPTELEIRVDNTSAIAALRKGRSKVWWLNNVASHFTKLADHLGVRFTISYVESAANKAGARAGSFELRHILFGISSILDAGNMMALKGLDESWTVGQGVQQLRQGLRNFWLARS